MKLGWDDGVMVGERVFSTGAYRDGERGKLDYEGILSPLALERYAKYMDKNRLQSNGELRDTDNWQQGMPKETYMKSLWRHVIAAWRAHRGYGTEEELEEALCGVLFNAFGYLHELGRGGLTEENKPGTL